MADEYLLTVTIPSVSGIASDAIVNTFPIQAFPGWDPALLLIEVTNPIAQFYNKPAGGRISEYIGVEMSRAALACSMKLYDVAPFLGGGAMGSPVATDAFGLGAGQAAQSHPGEVACVLTTRGSGWEGALIEAPDGGDPGVALDRPRSRRSGRIFIGPLNINTVTVDANGHARPSATFTDVVLDSAEATQGLLNGFGHEWAVWSRVDANFSNITDVQVDNAFDTQRRRGVRATTRTTRPV